MGKQDKEKALAALVSGAGKNLKRPKDEVEPYVKPLLDNWFDCAEAIADAKPEELGGLGIPLRFAKELIRVACKETGQEEPDAAPSNAKRPRTDDATREEVSEDGLNRILPVKRAPVEFKIKGRIIGKGGENVKHIEEECGVKLRVHGDNNTPIQIEIQGKDSSEEAQVEQATDLVKALLHTVYMDLDEFQKSGGGGSRGGRDGDDDRWNSRDDRQKGKGRSNGEKEYKDSIRIFDTDTKFRCRGKIIGERGQNVHHIQDETGARIELEGEQERGEQLVLHISASSQRDLKAAKRLSHELIDSVRQQYDEWLYDGQGSGDRGRGKGKGKDKSSGRDSGRQEKTYEKIIDVFYSEPEFKLKSKLIGKKGTNLHHIKDETGCELWLQGDSEKGEDMHFQIKASGPRDLKAAERLVHELMDTFKAEYDRGEGREYDDGRGRGKGSGKGREKPADAVNMQDAPFSEIIDIREMERDFRPKGKLIGSKASNLHHIQDETGAKVFVRGEEGEPMQFEIFGNSQKDVNAAKKLCRDLLESIEQRYDEWLAGDKKDDKETFKQTIEAFETDPSFRLRGKLLGKQGANVRDVEEKTGAKVQVVGNSDHGELMTVEITAGSQDEVDDAERMVKDLLDTISAEYQEWLDGGRESRENRDKDGRGKGKGRDKGKSRNDRDREHRKVLTLFECGDPAGFHLRNKITGKDDEHFKHIETETGAKLELLGREDSRDRMRIEIRAEQSDDLNQAVEMATDLISSVESQYNKFKARGNRRPREHDTDGEPPSKRRSS